MRKESSTILIITEMQIKTAMRHILTRMTKKILTTLIFVKHGEQTKLSSFVGGHTK